MRNEGWRPRQIREYLGSGKIERHFPRMDTSELVATLDRVGVGYPITFNNNPYAPLFRIGYVVPLGEGTNFVCMDNGAMQIRTGNKGLDIRYPLTMLASLQANQPFEKAEEAREFFLNARRSTEEVVITNSKRRHKKSFYDALGKVKEILEDTYTGIQEQNNMLDAIMPQGEGLRERVELEEQLRDKQTRVIDSLAQEKFGKALVETIEGTDVIGYALPVPFERDGRIDEDTRKLILLKEEGLVFVVDIPEASRAASAYASTAKAIRVGTHQEFVGLLRSSQLYAKVTSNEPGDDLQVLSQSYEPAARWLETKRDQRRTLENAASATLLFLDTAGEVTKPTLEERARELGADFLGVEAIRKFEEYLKQHHGKEVTFNLNAVPLIPYSEADLRIARTRGEMLVLRPQEMTENGTIEKITLRGLVSLLGNPDDVVGRDEFFASSVGQIKLGWALVSKNVLPGTRNRTWPEQQVVLQAYATQLDREGGSMTYVTPRTALEAMWDTTLDLVNNQRRLLMDSGMHDRTRTRYNNGLNVHVGFGRNGNIDLLTYLLPKSVNIGVCTSR